MQWILSLLVLLALLDTAFTLSCFRCDMVTCKIPTCTTGLVKDPCGCCDVCSKGKGERCGGPWHVYGKCDTGLGCRRIVRPGQLEFNAAGVCRPRRA